MGKPGLWRNNMSWLGSEAASTARRLIRAWAFCHMWASAGITFLAFCTISNKIRIWKQSTLDISNSDTPNSVKLEASFWIKNTFWSLSSIINWRWRLFLRVQITRSALRVLWTCKKNSHQLWDIEIWLYMERADLAKHYLLVNMPRFPDDITKVNLKEERKHMFILYPFHILLSAVHEHST